MRAIVFITIICGSWSPYFAEAATFDEYTNENATSEVVDRRPNKHQLTHEQKSMIEQFRTQYSAVLTDDYLRSDSHISGLLEANKWSLAQGSKMLMRVLTWRNRNKVEDLNYIKSDPDLIKRFPWSVTAKTRDGCPVLEIGWGHWLVADYLESHEFVRDGIKTYNKHSDQMWERARWATKKLSPKCEQAVLIADIKGFAMKNVAEANALNAVIRMALTLNDKYSNLFEVIFCVNAPPDFITLMKTLQPSLGVSAKAFRIYSEKEVEIARKHVLAYVDPAELTEAYLGTKKDL